MVVRTVMVRAVMVRTVAVRIVAVRAVRVVRVVPTSPAAAAAALEPPRAVSLLPATLVASVARARARGAYEKHGAVASCCHRGARAQLRSPAHHLAQLLGASEHQGVGKINAVVERGVRRRRGLLRTLLLSELQTRMRAVTVPSQLWMRGRRQLLAVDGPCQ